MPVVDAKPRVSKLVESRQIRTGNRLANAVADTHRSCTPAGAPLVDPRRLRVASSAMATATQGGENVAVLSAPGLSCPAASDELLAVHFEAFENHGCLNPLADVASSRRLA